jgi:DNA-binding MarR family transcriptional regulator
MRMDLLRDFGAMTFASRLKRLGDRLKAEATKLYHVQGIEFNDSWFLVAFLLSRNEGLSVTDMADMLGISRAAVSQMYRAMERKGLLVVHTDDSDRRRRLLYLTEEGRVAVAALEPIWNAIGECTEELVASSGRDVLKAITDIERMLEQRSLFERVGDRLRQPAE